MTAKILCSKFHTKTLFKLDGQEKLTLLVKLPLSALLLTRDHIYHKKCTQHIMALTSETS